MACLTESLRGPSTGDGALSRLSYPLIACFVVASIDSNRDTLVPENMPNVLVLKIQSAASPEVMANRIRLLLANTEVDG